MTAYAAPYNTLLARGRTEPSVAIDPRNPSVIVVGSNPDYNAPVSGTFPDGAFASHNAGKAFHATGVPLVSPYTTAADPSVAIDGHGTVYFGMLGETPAYCSIGHSAIMLSTSGDGGNRFRAPTIVDVNSADDKPFMAIETMSSGPSHVMMSWTRFAGKGSSIWFASSTNGGRTFDAATKLYSSQADNFGSVPVVAPNGRVYVFWSTFRDTGLHQTSPARVLMRSSTDDGKHFGVVHSVVGTFWSIPQMIEPGSLRSLTAPAAAADSHGALYLAWTAATHNHGNGVVDVDILLSHSTDGGLHWSRGKPVNDVRRGDRFMPSISALPNGSVGVAFYDRRSGPSDLNVYATRASFVGGFRHTPNARMNAGTSRIDDLHYIAPGSTCLASGRFFGDYIGTASAPDNSLFVTWTDTQYGAPGETDLWLARLYFPTLSNHA